MGVLLHHRDTIVIPTYFCGVDSTVYFDSGLINYQKKKIYHTKKNQWLSPHSNSKKNKKKQCFRHINCKKCTGEQLIFKKKKNIFFFLLTILLKVTFFLIYQNSSIIESTKVTIEILRFILKKIKQN